MATNHQGYEEPCDASINYGVVSSFPPWLGFIAWTLHAVRMQYPRSAHAPLSNNTDCIFMSSDGIFMGDNGIFSFQYFYQRQWCFHGW